MNFAMIMLNQNIKTMKNNVTYIYGQVYMDTEIFIIQIFIIKILHMMLKTDMIHQVMRLIDHYQKE